MSLRGFLHPGRGESCRLESLDLDLFFKALSLHSDQNVNNGKALTVPGCATSRVTPRTRESGGGGCVDDVGIGDDDDGVAVVDGGDVGCVDVGGVDVGGGGGGSDGENMIYESSDKRESARFACQLWRSAHA